MKVLEFDYEQIFNLLKRVRSTSGGYTDVIVSNNIIFTGNFEVEENDEYIQFIDASMNGFEIGLVDVEGILDFKDNFFERLYNLSQDFSENSLVNQIAELVGYEYKVIFGENVYYFRKFLNYDVPFVYDFLKQLMYNVCSENLEYICYNLACGGDVRKIIAIDDDYGLGDDDHFYENYELNGAEDDYTNIYSYKLDDVEYCYIKAEKVTY
jgi:hypothetical protein